MSLFRESLSYESTKGEAGMNIDLLNYMIWKTAHHFVSTEGFFLINNDEGTLTLRKSEGFVTTYLWLIPGDQFSNYKRIERELTDSLTWMSAFRRKTPSFFHKSIHLYIFTESDQQDLQKEIPKLRSHSLMGKYYSSAWVADLTSGQLFTPNTYSGLSKKLKEGINQIVKETAFQHTPFGESLDKQLAQWQDDMSRNQHRTQRTYRKAVREGKGAPLTFTFAAVNLLVWLLMTIYGGSTNTETLILFGAKYNPLIEQGEYWRLITPIFLHIGGFHLWFNSLALLALGSRVERIFGNFRFLLIYLFAGIVGTFSSFLFSPAVSAGASGAIFGLFGALLFFAFKKPGAFGHTMGPGLITGLGVNLILGFVMPGIDNYAHLGGLLGGFIAAFILRMPRTQDS